MPAILTTSEAREAWLQAPLADALALVRPLPDNTLRVVARGEEQDGEAALVNMATRASRIRRRSCCC